MSPKRWILLLIFYISYLMFGASIYYHIEHGEEKVQRAEELQERIEIHAYLVEQLENKNLTTQNEILEKISSYCGKPVTSYDSREASIPYTWTFYHAFFFAFTVCSTVGYGNISPTTTLGRMIMIVYSVIGIPVNGILFAGLGEYFGRTFEAIYRRYKKYKLSTDSHYVPPKLGLVTTVVIALIPGIAIFLLLPSWAFSYFEDWPYSIAFYYTYVTTTTIGFGDYVPTFGPNQPREFGGWFVVYQIFVIVWFIFSLGYLLMIMTFITRGLQSKKLHYIEQQLSSNLKATQNRIWTGVTKDVGYLRRLLNELYILKVKPVYTEPDFTYQLHRANSCPELTMYRTEPAPPPSRKRAFSVCYDANALEAEAALSPSMMMHASSDTELSKFDRTKSFETAEAYRQTTDLLAKVVTALATVKPPPADDDAFLYGGYNGFSDSQILASEWSFSTVNDMPPAAAPPRRPRGRACSDFNIQPHWQAQRPMAPHNEWTWSGDNDQIQEAINNRYRGRHGFADSHGNGNGHNVSDQTYVVQMDDSDEQLKKPPPQQRVKKFSMPDGLRRLFPFKKRASQDVGSESGGAQRKFSVVSVPEATQAKSPLDYYSTVTASGSLSYFHNGKPTVAAGALAIARPVAAYTSNTSLASRQSAGAGGGFTNLGFSDDAEQSTLNAGTTGAYQRKAGATRRRRESIYTQNPALSARRGSLHPPTAAAAAAASASAASHMQRRGSLAPSGSAAMAAVAARRGSLFPATAPGAMSQRRSSIFSVTSDRDMDVLEQTTLADLIRALEVVHTHAVLDEQQHHQQLPAALGGGGGGASGAAGGAKSKADKKQRKVGNAGLEPPQLPSILSLFAGDQTRTLTATAANRLYARRSTIVGTMPAVSGGAQMPRRRPSGLQLVEPPPSYSEKPPPVAASNVQTKFRRRFSVRPTALQIPPGQAPPPASQTAAVAAAAAAASAGGAATTSVPSMTATQISQTALQRRLSLRPSPLARELNLPVLSASAIAAAATSDASAALTVSATISPTSPPDALTSRLLPAAGAGVTPTRPSTSSTHSPLSRIVQISQAQRKSSMPDGLAGARKSSEAK